MNMKNLNVSDLFKVFSSAGSKEFRTIGEKARHDWKVMMNLFLFGLCCVTALSVSAFFRVGAEVLESAPQPIATSDQVDVELIRSIKESFLSRRVSLENEMPALPIGTDPSL
jgi:hypothetical protein